ncbi:MAG: PepSY domain-containing protein [Nitrosotalea sp.]
MQIQVDKQQAINIATRFLGQLQSDISSIDAVLEGNVWVVRLTAGMINPKEITVKINAKTGVIIGYS